MVSRIVSTSFSALARSRGGNYVPGIYLGHLQAKPSQQYAWNLDINLPANAFDFLKQRKPERLQDEILSNICAHTQWLSRLHKISTQPQFPANLGLARPPAAYLPAIASGLLLHLPGNLFHPSDGHSPGQKFVVILAARGLLSTIEKDENPFGPIVPGSVRLPHSHFISGAGLSWLGLESIIAMNRRRFLSGAAGVYGATLRASSLFDPVLKAKAQLSSDAGSLSSPDQLVTRTPIPAASGIDHIVIVTMENRSFDHFLGWLPGADGKQAGLHYVDTDRVSHATYPLAPDYTGCPHPGPDHSYQGSRIDYDRGKMNGFLKNPANDIFAIGYYTKKDIPFYADLALNYTTLSHYFCSMLGPTFPNRIFQLAAQTDRLDDSVSPSTLPTVLDSLNSAGVRVKYYFNNVPFLALWGLKYIPNTASYSDFLSDAAAGNLPAVSYVDPVYTLLDDGTGNDDHPHADIRRGDAFLARTFHAVAHGPGWQNTVFIVNFAENGGFFGQVRPLRAAAPNNVDPDIVHGKTLLGPRVPTVVASPFTRGNPSKPRIVNSVFDHTSSLKLIEWRWGLKPLTKRDASSDIENLAQALNFTEPNAEVPELPSPVAPAPQPCIALGAAEPSQLTEFGRLAHSDLVKGWPVR